MSVTVKVPPGGLGALIKASVKTHKEAVAQGIRIGAELGISHLQSTEVGIPIDRGLARAAWKSYPDGEIGRKVYNSAPYIGILERGARPHMPPLEPILGWVKRHFSDLGGNKKSADAEKDMVAIAEAICHSIAKKGVKPGYYVRDALPKLRDIVSAEVERSLAKALEGGK